ncbi:MAG: phosphatidate cytidylyltransferase [Bacteroidetes bacterium]|nr:MAG: phosphatidate cytidylyltransferase [Bacteroidota bacterium]
MALNVSIFKTRALTALVFVVVMLVGLLWNQWSFLILFSIIHFGCWYEYQKLVARIDPGYLQITPYHRYGVMLAGWCIMLFFTNNDFDLGRVSLHAIGYWGGLLLLFVLPLLEILLVQKINLRNIGYSAFGLIYISLSLGLFTNLRSTYGSALELVNKLLVFMIIGSIWINDTMAYLLGSMFGKTPLTSISPKKTWEGTIAGILSSILIMGAIGYFISSELDWETISQWMIIAAIASIAGTFGDLLQSKLKRMANVKDSGHIMPGHGGFLDRFDSLLLAAPFVWIYVVFIR